MPDSAVATHPLAPLAVDRPRLRGRVPVGTVYLTVLMGFTAIFGAAGAQMLLSDPTGEAAGIPTVYRELLPVGDYFLPGLFLLVAYVLVPIALAYGLVTRKEWGWTRRIDRRFGHHWAWTGSVALALVLVAWIAVEMVLFWSAPSDIMTTLWVIVLGLAGAILVGTMLPSVRRLYAAA